MKAMLLFLLIPLAMMAHVMVSKRFGWHEQWPIGAMAVMAVALAALLWRFLRIRPLKKSMLLLNVAAWLLVGFFLWWTQIYSAYPKMEGGTAIGGNVLSESSATGLVDSSGNPFRFPEAIKASSATLLVFYRGYW